MGLRAPLLTVLLLAPVHGSARADGPPAREARDDPPAGLTLTQTLDSPTARAQARFGSAVAVEGDRILIGAPRGDGSAAASGVVHAYELESRSGTWSLRESLSGSGTGPGAGFGSSLAMQGRLAVVGAPGDGPGGDGTGTVHVFRRGAGAWLERQRIVQGRGVTGSQFGADVALAGRWLLVGAPRHDVGAAVDAGAVFSFELDPSGRFVARGELLPRHPLSGAEFGRAVALDGRLAVVASPLSRRPDDPSSAPLGRAHLFSRGPAGGFVELQLLAPGYPLPGEDFAADVAIERTTVALAAPLRTVGGLSGVGTVLLLEPDPATGRWRLIRELIASNAKADDGFGRALAIDAGRLLVGSPDTPSGGAVYAFARDAGGPGAWGELGRLDNPPATGDFLGQAVDLAGPVGLAGAPFADAPGASAAGRAEVLGLGRAP